jgi:3'(2'), 5'-bisphosphate nucleotidase
MNDHQLAGVIAGAAGRILREIRADGLFTAGELGDIGDAISHQFIDKALRRHRPDDGLLSEEEADTAARLAHQRVWIVDPLDGTREYSEGRPDWAVHVALVTNGVATSGAVALPDQDRLLVTGTVGSLPVPLISNRAPRLVVSRSRPTEHAAQLAAAIGAELVPMGSAGAKAMAVVLGEADIYAHSGGQYEWDSAAPVAVARAAGFHTSRLDGSPLTYNQANPYMPDLLVCRPDLADQVLAICARLSSDLSADTA